MKIPQFLGLGGRPVCNILVATQPLVSVWELLMGVGKMGKLPILLPASPSVCEREKAYRGEKVTLEKKGLGVTCILRAHGTVGGWCLVSVRSVRKDGR